jgi:ribosomal protein S18 acetylase RimI-like enzyme
MPLRISIPETPTPAHREAVGAPLQEYNLRHGGDPKFRPVAILLTGENGQHFGGLWGKIVYDWLFVEWLAVPEAYRGIGYGKALMDEAQTIARANRCVGIWLDTFEFQARGFYEKLGFEIFGTLEDHPVGQRRYFLQKRIHDQAIGD